MRIYKVLVRNGVGSEDGQGYTLLGETAAENPRQAIEGLAKQKKIEKGEFVAVPKRNWSEVPGSFEPRFIVG